MSWARHTDEDWNLDRWTHDQLDAEIVLTRQRGKHGTEYRVEQEIDEPGADRGTNMLYAHRESAMATVELLKELADSLVSVFEEREA